MEAQIEQRKQLEAQWQAQSAALVAAGGVAAAGSDRALANEWAAQRTELLLATMPKENLAAFRAR